MESTLVLEAGEGESWVPTHDMQRLDSLKESRVLENPPLQRCRVYPGFLAGVTLGDPHDFSFQAKPGMTLSSKRNVVWEGAPVWGESSMAVK